MNGDLSHEELAAGNLVDVSFPLAGRELHCTVRCEIVWFNRADTDVDGRPVVGLGLRIVEFKAATEDLLAEFVDNFRYTVFVSTRDPSTLSLAKLALQEDFQIVEALTGSTPPELLSDVGVIVVDVEQDGYQGIETIRYVVRQFPHAHLTSIVLGARLGQDELAAMLNSGKVFHYLHKPCDPTDLRHVVRQAIDACALTAENQRLGAELERANQRLLRENVYLHKRAQGIEGFEALIGGSPALSRALAELARVRRTDATVHVHGEAGTGKELVANALHQGGLRAEKSFVVQACGGMNEALLRTVLFGQSRGTTSGIDRDRPGALRDADQGTLFLNEVAEMPLAIQGELLKVLRAGEVTPVGATQAEHFDVRLVSATHKDLKAEVSAGRFRDDLYQLLTTVAVRLPPLRQRGGDVLVLAQHFLDIAAERYGKDLKGFSTEAMQALENYSWPGNVRELESEIERVAIMADESSYVGLQLLSPYISAPAPGVSGGMMSMHLDGRSVDDILHDIERQLISTALSRHSGNRSAAAKELRIARQTLQDRLKKLGLAP